jgi:hypothetical protein
MTAPGPDAASTSPSGSRALLTEVSPLLERVSEIASAHAEDPQALLSLLRELERLHRSIQDGPFRSSLPSERGSLFRLLQDMETSGGWPYIPRLQLRTFLDLLPQPDSQVLPSSSEPDVSRAA